MATEPKRTCPPPTPIEHLRAGDRIRYQSTSMRDELEGIIETISPRGLITMVDGRAFDGPTSYVLLVEMAPAPSLKPGGSGRTEAEHELRRHFVEAVGALKAANPDCLYETCVAEVASQLEFRDLRCANLNSYYWWRDRYCLAPPQVERRQKAAAKRAKSAPAKPEPAPEYVEIRTTESAPIAPEQPEPAPVAVAAVAGELPTPDAIVSMAEVFGQWCDNLLTALAQVENTRARLAAIKAALAE
ncbi:MAG: hypothetical protein WC977_07330 [Anaerovoracaceae bacterium]|jgi:nitrite reductase/ring-hydroxylating ferredoxin subunit